jgi:hypothetical protein
MKHVLLTKVAMRFAADNPRRRYEKPGWVDYRIGLFKKYCVPSVEAQTVKDFDWWFLVNRSFPGLEQSHIDTLNEYGKVIEIDAPWNETQPEVGAILSSTYKNEWVCTTRLDSDDMLHARFFEMLKSEVAERELWVSFEYGYIIKDGQAAIRQYAVNPFLSYVEYASPLKTVFHVAHHEADRRAREFRVIPQIGWAQIDHGDNIKNHASVKVKNFNSVKVPVEDIEGFPCT